MYDGLMPWYLDIYRYRHSQEDARYETALHQAVYTSYHIIGYMVVGK